MITLNENLLHRKCTYKYICIFLLNSILTRQEICNAQFYSDKHLPDIHILNNNHFFITYFFMTLKAILKNLKQSWTGRMFVRTFLSLPVCWIYSWNYARTLRNAYVCCNSAFVTFFIPDRVQSKRTANSHSIKSTNFFSPCLFKTRLLLTQVK